MSGLRVQTFMGSPRPSAKVAPAPTAAPPAPPPPPNLPVTPPGRPCRARKAPVRGTHLPAAISPSREALGGVPEGHPDTSLSARAAIYRTVYVRGREAKPGPAFVEYVLTVALREQVEACARQLDARAEVYEREGGLYAPHAVEARACAEALRAAHGLPSRR